MPAPLVTSNPAEYTRLEGVYVTERNPPGFIKGVALNTVGIIGQTTRGPVDTPVEITSESRFLEVFGGRDYGNGGVLINHIWRDMLNKPFGKMIVVRAAASAAVVASFTEEDTDAGGGTAIIRIDASSKGLWGNEVYFRIETATDADADHFNLAVRLNGETRLFENLNTKTASDDNLSTVIGDDYGTWITVTKLADGRPLNTADNTVGGPYALALDTGLVTTGYMALGTTVASYDSVAGTEGTIAATDYTATSRALDQIATYSQVAIVLCSEDDETISQAVNTAINTKAAASSDRLFLIWSGDHTDPVATAVSYFDGVDAGTNDRLVKCFDSPYTLDTETSLLIQVPPHSWMASILSQTEVDDHPGAEESKAQTAGISKLTLDALAREDYVTLREAGICTLERDSGFSFVSGVTSSLVSGRTEITRRRSTDKIQLSLAARLKFFVKARNTVTNRRIMAGEATDFLEGFLITERIVEEYEIDQDGVNTTASRAESKEFMLVRVKLIGHILHLILLTEIGTGVVIEG